MNSRQLIEILDKLAAPKLAQSWDNTGVSFGNLDKEISKIMLALEPSEVVIDQAIQEKVDVLITHHPMIFKPVGALSYDSLIGRKITKLAQNDIVAFSMHTNMDVAVMALKSADILGLKDAKHLEVTYLDEATQTVYGFGSIGSVDNELSMLECVDLVKEKLNINTVRVIGDMTKKVKKIAILPGSGKSFISNVLKENVDVLITGDIDYHSASDAIDMGVSIIDAGHFETEHFFVDYMEEFLKKICSDLENTSFIITKARENSPFKYV